MTTSYLVPRRCHLWQGLSFFYDHTASMCISWFAAGLYFKVKNSPVSRLLRCGEKVFFIFRLSMDCMYTKIETNMMGYCFQRQASCLYQENYEKLHNIEISIFWRFRSSCQRCIWLRYDMPSSLCSEWTHTTLDLTLWPASPANFIQTA